MSGGKPPFPTTSLWATSRSSDVFKSQFRIASNHLTIGKPPRPRAFDGVPFIPCVQSSLQMRIEPPHDPIQPVEQVLLFLQTMGLARIHDELAFNPVAFQRTIQHLALS